MSARNMFENPMVGDVLAYIGLTFTKSFIARVSEVGADIQMVCSDGSRFEMPLAEFAKRKDESHYIPLRYADATPSTSPPTGESRETQTTATGKSIVRQNAERDPNYCPYCLKCTRLRMVKVEPFLWTCQCGARHDERDATLQPSPVPDAGAVEKAVKALTPDLNLCPISFKHLPHDACDGKPNAPAALAVKSVEPVGKTTPDAGAVEKALENLVLWAEDTISSLRQAMVAKHKELRERRDKSWEPGTRGDLQPYAYLEDQIARELEDFQKRNQPVIEANKVLDAALATMKAKANTGDIERAVKTIPTLTLASLRDANKTRSVRWSGGTSCGIEFAAVELAGEVGEACNAIKKLSRLRRGMKGGVDTTANLTEELADVVICADLLAMEVGIDLSSAVAAKFNATSVKHGFHERLGVPDVTPAGPHNDGVPSGAEGGGK